ncbi:MAG: hypothetical protein BWY82_00156 [Verrucomicrobia bacterium ADurb.Bin474]|nr:MAG: hypothetical protein BWY82_00156 [Verrucomicrobia bacterium ADurb.Bin474]
MGLKRKHRDGFLNERAQIEFLREQFELSSFNLGQIKNVVDQREQGVRARPDGFRIVVLLFIKRCIQKKVGHADDCVHRGPDLVAHVCQKLSFRPVGGSRLCHSICQLFVDIDQSVLDPLSCGDVTARSNCLYVPGFFVQIKGHHRFCPHCAAVFADLLKLLGGGCGFSRLKSLDSLWKNRLSVCEGGGGEHFLEGLFHHFLGRISPEPMYGRAGVPETSSLQVQHPHNI